MKGIWDIVQDSLQLSNLAPVTVSLWNFLDRCGEDTLPAYCWENRWTNPCYSSFFTPCCVSSISEPQLRICALILPLSQAGDSYEDGCLANPTLQKPITVLMSGIALPVTMADFYFSYHQRSLQLTYVKCYPTEWRLLIVRQCKLHKPQVN